MALLTAPLYAGWLVTRPVAWVVPRSDKGLQRFWVGSWAKGMLRVMGVRARYQGPFPEAPFFLVSNHLSYVDIPVLLSRLDARFLAKSEVASWPVAGLLARSTGTLFVDRSKKRDLTRILPAVRGVLDRGTGVIIFPEGTTTDGSAVQAFKPSLFEVPVEMGLKVRCASLHYDSPEGSRPAWETVCWYGDAPFAPHFLQFLKQRRTDATVTFSAENVAAPATGGSERRKDLARAAHRAVERTFTPSRPIPPEPEPPTARTALPHSTR
ncbi:MAG: lysophospholipid acyltransferase family protein [Planctomycetota bacterium]